MKKEDLKTGDNLSQKNMVNVDETLIRKYISTDRLLRPWSKDGKKGFVDIDGNWIIDPVYDDVDVFRESVAWVKTGDKWGLINAKGEMVIAPKYDDAREFNDGLAAVKVSGNWGIIDCADNIIIEAAYDNIWSVKRDWVVVRKDGLYGFVNPANGKIIAPIYKTVREFSEVRAAVELNNKWGFVDINGDVVITPQFSYVSDYLNGKSEVITPENMWGDIDLQGNAIEPFEEYDEQRECYSPDPTYYEEPWGVRCYYGFVNREGEIVIKMKYRDAYDFSYGISMVLIDDKWGIIDHTGAYLVEPQFSEADIEELLEKLISATCPKTEKKNDTPTCYPDDALMSRLREEYDIVDCQEGVITIGYEHLEDDPDGFPFDISIRVCGLADYDGNIIVEPKYRFNDRIDKGVPCNLHISDGLAAVRVDDKCGYINTKGEMVITPQFDEAKPFRNQRAVVKTNGLYGLIDNNGNFVLQPRYKKISQNSTQIMGNEYGDYYALMITSKYGFDAIGHRDGKVAMLPKKFIIGHLGQDGMAVIQQPTDGELFGYANCETGNIIEPCYNYTHPFNEGLGNVRLTEEQLLRPTPKK